MVIYLDKVDADIWVMQKGVSNMHMASSMLWDWKIEKISQIYEVEDVAAVLYLNGPVKIAGKNWFSYVLGITPEYSRVGPWSITQGKSIPEKGEAIIPEVIAKLSDIKIGDVLTLTDRKLRIVGLTKDTYSMASSLVFVSRADLAEVLNASDQYSYIMVYAKPGANHYQLKNRIEEEVDKVNVLTADEFIKNDWQLAVQMGVEIVNMMRILGTLLATLIVAFTGYSLIIRKKQELAIAKALGFKNWQMYSTVLFQSLILSLLGLILALIISFGLLARLPDFVPQINLSIQLHQFTFILIFIFPIASIASIIAARSIVKLDPVIVFQN